MEQIKRSLTIMIPPLLTWYRQNKAPLPWREDRDPYRIWISEIMLQQTRIEAVIPYYHRFLSEIPTIEALAQIPDERLMKLWEGLGYYSRARNLKRAAITIMETYGGQMPHTAEHLRKLPGIGDYTAGAIASIAFGEAEPAVDGNVLRVGMRLLGRYDDIALPATKKNMSLWLRSVYPSGCDAGDLTEGLMELGERICIPNGEPLCHLCPLREHCRAGLEGLTDRIPVKSSKKARKEEQFTVLLLCSQQGIALHKRDDKGLLAGLWEYPMISGFLSKEEAFLWAKEMGLAPTDIVSCGHSEHIFTHVTWNMQGYRILCDRTTDAFTWETAQNIAAHYAIPTAFRFYQKKSQKQS
ncbi:MAG: A/G-specific adenine glycosylase [Clostridia bacterium]|nr:A/G-specific adenine glycosylase [Clostridia bacterium]